MNAEEKEMVKDVMVKIEGTLNILRSSPEVVASNKLLGISQKLGAFLNSQEKNTDINENNKD